MARSDPSSKACRTEATAKLPLAGDERSEIAGIQYLRGFCATAVVIDHASGMVALSKYFGKTILSGVLTAGAVGVDLFFVISGFIITIVSLRSDTLLPRISRADFGWKRCARILPLMWLAILSYAALRGMFRSTEFDAAAYLRAVLLLPGGGVEPNVVWTLRHEAVFYLVFALTFLGRRWLRPVLALWFLSPLIYTAVKGTMLLEPGMSWEDVVFGSANLQFGAGFLVGLVWLRRAEMPLRAPSHAVPVLLCLTALVIAVSNLPPFLWRSIPATLWTTALALALVWYATHLGHADTWLGRGALLLGNASYSIYLFHLHVLSAVLGITAKLLPAIPAGLVLIGAVVAALGVGVVTHLLVERPLLAATRLIQRRSVAPPARRFAQEAEFEARAKRMLGKT